MAYSTDDPLLIGEGGRRLPVRHDRCANGMPICSRESLGANNAAHSPLRVREPRIGTPT